MIIDIHAHVVAPPELYAFGLQLNSSGGHHGKGNPNISDEALERSAQSNIATMDSVGTDVQFISPRPFQMQHSLKPGKLVHWWLEAINTTIGREAKAHPDRFGGMCGLPQVAGAPVSDCFEELERCVNELGFVGCLLNPDPGEGDGQTPPLGDEYWYPLYEKLVALDVPALIHSSACRNGRESYSNHFITEESIAIMSLIDRGVLTTFPNLKLIVSHGGGSVPYQIGRWRAHHWRSGHTQDSFDDDLRKLYFDTILYNQESLELLFKICKPDRCMFGTEKPGSGSAKDPNTGKWLDDLKPVIEGISFLSQEDKRMIFEENARRVFTRFKVPAAV